MQGETLKFCTMFERALFCLKVPKFRTLAFLIRVVLRIGWAWSIGGMKLTEDDRSTGRMAYPSATSSPQISHRLTRVCHLCHVRCPFQPPCSTLCC